MVSKEKKPYGAPDIEKVPLSDEDLDKVSGGAQPDGAPGPDTDEEDIVIDTTPYQQEVRNTDIYRRGCDGVNYRRG